MLHTAPAAAGRVQRLCKVLDEFNAMPCEEECGPGKFAQQPSYSGNFPHENSVSTRASEAANPDRYSRYSRGT